MWRGVINALPHHQGAHDFGNPTITVTAVAAAGRRPGAPQTINVAVRHPRRYGFCLSAEPPPSRFVLFFTTECDWAVQRGHGGCRNFYTSRPRTVAAVSENARARTHSNTLFAAIYGTIVGPDYRRSRTFVSLRFRRPRSLPSSSEWTVISGRKPRSRRTKTRVRRARTLIDIILVLQINIYDFSKLSFHITARSCVSRS